MNNTKFTPAALIDALYWRYATKKFDPDKKLTENQVRTLLESLRLAPSSMGLQPYRFVRVVDPEIRKALREVSSNQAQITDASDMVVIAANLGIPESDVKEFVHLGGELRGYPEDSMHRRVEGIMRYLNSFDPAELVQWNSRQAYIAIGQLLVSAAVLGIDACPMEGIKGDEYNRILGLNSINLKALAVVALGFRSSEDELQHQPKVRKPIEQIILTI